MAMTNYGLPLSTDNLHHFFESVDADKDGWIGFDDWADVVMLRRPKSSRTSGIANSHQRRNQLKSVKYSDMELLNVTFKETMKMLRAKIGMRMRGGPHDEENVEAISASAALPERV